MHLLTSYIDYNKINYEEPIRVESGPMLVPVLIGAAAVAAITYLLIADDAEDLRDKLSENLQKGWNGVKDNIPVTAAHLTAIKEKIKETVSDLADTVKV